MYSYVMVWMITIIGSTFMIPDTVMGLTFIAAGVSVPDALAGIAVVKEGKYFVQQVQQSGIIPSKYKIIFTVDTSISSSNFHVRPF